MFLVIAYLYLKIYFLLDIYKSKQHKLYKLNCSFINIQAYLKLFINKKRVDKMKELFEICLYSRASQGAKTIAELLARTAILEGKYAQAFSEYGSERYGAPMEVFLRVSNKPIKIHTPIIKPDLAVILDPSLIYNKTFDTKILVINSSKELKLKNYKRIYTIDASKISIQNLGKDLPNIPILALIEKISDIVSLNDLKKIIYEHFKDKYNQEIAEKNLKVFEIAYQK